MEKKSIEKEQDILARLRQDIIDNNLHVKAIIQVSVYNKRLPEFNMERHHKIFVDHSILLIGY